MENLKSTKFIYCVMVIVMAFVLTVMRMIESQAFLSFAEIIGGSYIIGNVASKVIKRDSAE